MIKVFDHYSDAAQRKACRLLTEKFGDSGYAFWFRLLEFLNQHDAEPFDVSDENNMFLLTLYCHPTQRDFIKRKEEVEDILNFCATYKDEEGETLISSAMWEDKKVWSKKNHDKVQRVLKRRKKENEVDTNDPLYKFATIMFNDIAKLFSAYGRFPASERERRIKGWVPKLGLLTRKYDTNVKELVMVWNWLSKSKDKQAIFWREQIRSSNNLEKHYPKLLQLAEKHKTGNTARQNFQSGALGGD